MKKMETTENIKINKTDKDREVNTINPEVVPQKVLRRFTAAQKLRIIAAADACQNKLELGALYRKEGIFSNYLRKWRKQKDEGLFDIKAQKAKQELKNEASQLSKKVVSLERENAALEKKLKQAQAVISVQKKISEIMNISIDLTENGEKEQ
jgi:transposase-like protein